MKQKDYEAKILADAFYGKENPREVDLAIIRMAIKLRTPNANELTDAYYAHYEGDSKVRNRANNSPNTTTN